MCSLKGYSSDLVLPFREVGGVEMEAEISWFLMDIQTVDKCEGCVVSGTDETIILQLQF